MAVAAFRFVARNPATILIAGGILFYFVGALQPNTVLLNVAPWLIGIGIILHVLWLTPRKRWR